MDADGRVTVYTFDSKAYNPSGLFDYNTHVRDPQSKGKAPKVGSKTRAPNGQPVLGARVTVTPLPTTIKAEAKAPLFEEPVYVRATAPTRQRYLAKNKVVSVTAVKTETVVLADKSKPIVHHYKLGGDDPGLKDKWVCSALRDDPRKINIEVVDVLPPFNATVAEHEEARGSRLVTPSAQGGGVQHIWMDLSVETEEHISLEIVKSCGCSKGSTLCNTVSCGSLP